MRRLSAAASVVRRMRFLDRCGEMGHKRTIAFNA